jgi:PEP-CTERM motif
MSTKPSRTSKLIQAAALAAVLVPLGSVAVETSTITHSYSGTGTGSPQNNLIFDFGPYELRLNFENLAEFARFAVDVTDVPTNQLALTGRLPAGHVCVPMVDPSSTVNPCVEFEVDAPDPSPTTWTGFYDMTIAWDFDTDPTFPDFPGGRIRLLHNESGDPGNAFNADITTEGSYFNGFDPAIGGRDDNFQSFIVTQNGNAAVPEPATLFLVTTGVSGLLYRRRRKQNAEVAKV